MKKINKSVIFICSLFLLLNLAIPVFANSIAQSEPEVIVEVYVNNFDDSFIENITFDDGTKIGDYNYTIKYMASSRSAYTLAQYFDYAAFVTRSGVVTLSLLPTDLTKSSTSNRDSAWNCLLSKNVGLGNSPYWQNVECMKWQFDCHYAGKILLADDETWDIEPHRTADSYLEVLLAKCNP